MHQVFLCYFNGTVKAYCFWKISRHNPRAKGLAVKSSIAQPKLFVLVSQTIDLLVQRFAQHIATLTLPYSHSHSLIKTEEIKLS